MINKKTTLGRTPDKLGVKDAVHVATVSLRAGRPLKRGQRIELNGEREAIPAGRKGFGVVDPWAKKDVISTGEHFLALLDPQEVDSVGHTWEHELDFSPPSVPERRNQYLQESADLLHVSYNTLMQALEQMVDSYQTTPYSGPLSKGEFDEVWERYPGIERYELYSEWAEETGYGFSNTGTECCPEYDYPDIPFEYV